MTFDTRNSGTDRRDPKEFLRGFVRQEDGMVTIFAAFMIFCMLMIGGIGVDMMRHEMERVRIQSVADRAVLAAADLDQKLDSEAVVRDYFSKSGMADFVSQVDVDEGLNYRTVSVDAGTTVNTMFMDYLGVETLHVPALSTAEERVPNVEISLVLDISGSMRFSSRMDELRPAAVDFINTVLADDVKATTSVTLVPYAGQTNPGPFMFDRLNGVRNAVLELDEDMGGIPEDESHGTLDPDADGGEGIDSDDETRYVFPNISSCLDINPTGFGDTQLPAGALYPQTAHFMNWKIASTVMDWGWCPQDQTSIRYMTNNRNQLNGLINSMRMHDGTGTHYAMKWAVAMLDPSSQDDVTALAAAGQASNDFVGRPAPYSDESTLKYIVLMTDGQITEQVRPINWDDNENPTVELNEGRKSERERITTSSTNVSSFMSQCNLAKGKTPRPIIIYTIAFEAPGTPETQMRNCASSPSHFFSVKENADTDEGEVETIADAFDAIARQINQLRLIQ